MRAASGGGRCGVSAAAISCACAMLHAQHGQIIADFGEVRLEPQGPVIGVYSLMGMAAQGLDIAETRPEQRIRRSGTGQPGIQGFRCREISLDVCLRRPCPKGQQMAGSRTARHSAGQDSEGRAQPNPFHRGHRRRCCPGSRASRLQAPAAISMVMAAPRHRAIPQGCNRAQRRMRCAASRKTTSMAYPMPSPCTEAQGAIHNP